MSRALPVDIATPSVECATLTSLGYYSYHHDIPVQMYSESRRDHVWCTGTCHKGLLTKELERRSRLPRHRGMITDYRWIYAKLQNHYSGRGDHAVAAVFSTMFSLLGTWSCCISSWVSPSVLAKEYQPE